MPLMRKSNAPRKADTSRSSGKDRASTAGTKAIEGRRVPALTIAYSPKESHDINADIVFVGGVYGDNVHWPSQLLPTDVPFARVLMYDHEPNRETFFAATADNDLGWHAKKLLFDLARTRADSHTEDRLIIFVAHGIGGLIIKHSLGIAKDSAISGVAELTVGILFFGTRHRGSDTVGWAKSKIARLAGLIKVSTINEITSASRSVDRVSSDFHELLNLRSKIGTVIKIETFHEALSTPGIGSAFLRHDAALPGHSSNSLRDSQTNLARFSNQDDLGYRMITASVRRWIGLSIEHEIEECREAFLQSLYFEEIFDWQNQIDDACPQIEDWILSQSYLKLAEWLAEGGEPIWIYGKPGCGKSTLMKYLATSQRVTGLLVNESGGSDLIATASAFSVAYFFNGGRMTLGKSLIGMLRSLIWQILRQQPAAFDPSFLLPGMQHRYASQKSWNASELFKVLRALLQLDYIRPVNIFIGALDKVEDSGQEDPIAHLAHLLNELAAKMSRSFRLILSSRPLAAFMSAFALHRQINLSWCETGSLPSQLSELYDRMFSKRDISDDSEFMRMFAAVIYAVRPLSMQEICVVVDAWDPEWKIEWGVSSERQDDLEQKLLTWSQGLLDVQSGLVKFVSRSAREHVKKFLVPQFRNAPPDGDMIILRACLLYLQHMHEEMERHCHDTDSELSGPWYAFVENLPFLHYAVTFWVLHGIRLQRKIEPHLFEMEIQRMHRNHFEYWKFYFMSARESSEGNTAQQEVEGYLLARFSGVATPIELVSQMNTQVRGPLGVEEAGSPDPDYALGPNLGFRGVDRENGANELDLDQKESDTNPPRSQGTVAARLERLYHQSVEDGFSPIFLEQESALGLDSSETSKIREVLLALFINDDVLHPIYKTALETMSPGEFERNLQELLISFANDLQEEAHEVHEHNISNFFGSNRKDIARYIRILFTKESCVCDDDIRQPQLQLPDSRGGLLPILSALRSSQTHSKEPNTVHELERFVTDSKAFVTLQTRVKRFAKPTSAAVPTEERSPMVDDATNIPSNISQLLNPPLNFIRSLLFCPYRYIVGQVLGFLQVLNIYEPPLSSDCVRLKWICVCGNSFFRDFVHSEMSSAYGLRDLLLTSGYQAALFVNPINSQAAAHGSDVMRQSTTNVVNNQGTRPLPSPYHAIEPSNQSQILRDEVSTPNDPSEILEGNNGLKAMWIILCFYYDRHVSQAVHLETQESDDDVSLVKHARQKHFEKRGWFAYYMSWKAVKKIAFVKFGYILDPMIEEGLALLHEDWVPPEGWKDTKFWKPRPAEPRPMAEQRFLLHLWDHPHNSRTYLVIQTTKLRLIEQAKSLLTKWRIQKLQCYGWLKETRDQYKRFRGGNTSSEQLPYSNPNDLHRIDDHGDSPQRAIGKGRYLFKSTPKRLGEELKAHLDEPPLGWGLHFEESIVVPAPLRYLGIFIIIALTLSAVVSTLILVHEKGVAYFGMGNFGIGIAAIVTTLVLNLIAV